MPLKDATLRILSLTPFISRQRWRRRRSPCPSAWRRTWPTWTSRSTERSRPWTSGWTARWWGWTPAWGRSLPGWQRIFFSSANFHLIYQVDNIFFICSFSFFCQVDSKDGEEGVLPKRKTGQAGAFQWTFRYYWPGCQSAGRPRCSTEARRLPLGRGHRSEQEQQPVVDDCSWPPSSRKPSTSSLPQCWCGRREVVITMKTVKLATAMGSNFFQHKALLIYTVISVNMPTPWM